MPNMRKEHIAIWTQDIELLKSFYIKYFSLTCGKKYFNPKRKFTSYFLSFGDGKTRMELMHIPEIGECEALSNWKGLAHIAISVGDKALVDSQTEKLRQDGFAIASEPRTTGDGYYESAVLDPEGNYIEIMA